MNPSYTDLVNKIASILPNATFGEDNDGQLIIYTNLAQTSRNDDNPLETFYSEE